jgi:eukaryotic-like serine/threonine-protein kinase
MAPDMGKIRRDRRLCEVNDQVSDSSSSESGDADDDSLDQLLRQVAQTPYAGSPRPIISIGDCLANRFEVQRKLGAGGMGQVYAVFDRLRQARVAAKLLGRLTPQAIGLIKREFRVASDLVHPHLVRLHELTCDGDLWFFTMELVEGITLPQLLKARRSPTPDFDLLRSVLGQLASAVDALHRGGLLHRDLKPANFLISGHQHRVTLLDFGLARPLDAERTGDSSGTPSYMAPEQVAGDSLTTAADWYAIGVILYEALTGKLPRDRRFDSSLPGVPADLADLCLSLLRSEPQERPTGEEILHCLGAKAPVFADAPSVPGGSTPTILGRDEELEKLRAALADAKNGMTRSVLIEGPSGIGKTALVERFVEEARDQGAWLLTSRCRERESMSYKAADGLIDGVIELLHRMTTAEAAALLPEDLTPLTRLFPALLAVPAVKQRVKGEFANLDVAIVRSRAISAFADMMGRFRGRAPLILWIDDLQWSDTDSALLIGPLLGGANPVRLLFIGTHRGIVETGCPLLEALERDRSLSLPPPTHITLGPLAEEVAERLALLLLPGRDSEASALAGQIRREAGGNPLFIAELARDPRSSNSTGAAQAGASFSEFINRRVRALPTGARSLLELAAVCGLPVERALLREITGTSAAEVEESLDVLRLQRLASSQGPTAGGLVEVRHDRIREVIVDRLDAETRRRSHLKLVRALAERPDTKPEVLATHHEGAGDMPRAGRCWIATAEQAMSGLAFRRAAELFRKGLTMADLSADETPSIQVRMAEALAYAGKGAEAAEVYLVVANRSPSEAALELRRRAAEQRLMCGHFDAGLEVIEEVLRGIRMKPTYHGRKALLPLVLGRVRIRLRGLGHRTRTDRELTTEEIARLDASWTIASSLGSVDFIRAAEFQNRHLLMALAAGEPRRVLRALILEAAYVAAPGRGSTGRSLRFIAQAEELARRVQDETVHSFLGLTKGVVAYLEGRLEEAQAHLEEVLTVRTKLFVSGMWEMVTAHRFLIATLFYLGRVRRLSAVLPSLMAEAEVNGNIYAGISARCAYATLSWLARDQVLEARQQVARTRSEWKGGGSLTECSLLFSEVMCDLYEREGERALEKIRQDWNRIKEEQILRISVTRVLLRYFLAGSCLMVAEQRERGGAPVKARKLRAEAAAIARQLRADQLPRGASYANVIEAALARAAGDLDGCREKLRVAISSMEGQGMVLFAAAAQARLASVLDGEAGTALMEQALVRLRQESVQEPDRMLNLLAPGF